MPASIRSFCGPQADPMRARGRVSTSVRSVVLTWARYPQKSQMTSAHRRPCNDAVPGLRKTVLTDLLTTTMDGRGRGWSQEPGKQGRSDLLDGRGRVKSTADDVAAGLRRNRGVRLAT